MVQLSPLSPLDEKGKVVVDIGRPKGERDGADILSIDRANGAVTLLVELAWDPAYSDGWRRFAWTLCHPPAPALPKLLLVASPEVEITVKDKAAAITSITRVQAANHVPQLGEPIRLGSLLPPRCPVVDAEAGIGVSDPQLRPPTDPASPQAWYRMPLTDEAAVSWLGDGALIRHRDGHWWVRITVGQHQPVGFALQLDAAPAAGVYALARSAFTLRIVRHGEVDIEVRELITNAPLRASGLARELRLSRVDVSVADDRGDLLPLSGVDLDRHYDHLPSKYFRTEAENLFFNTVVTLAVIAAGFVPGSAGAVLAVGLLVYELGNLAWAATHGHDLLGNLVPEEQLPIMAAFALLSVVLTPLQVVGAVRAVAPRPTPKLTRARLIKVAQELHSIGAITVDAVAAVDGAAADLQALSSPLVRDALRRMPPDAAERLMAALEAAVAQRFTLPAIRSLARVLLETVAPLLTDLPRIAGIPTVLYAEAMKTVDVANTAAWALLTPQQRQVAGRAISAARASGDPTLLRLAEISAALEEEYTALVRDVVVQRVLGPKLDGFRTPLLQPSILSGALEKGYASYVAAKNAAGKKPADFLLWVARQPVNSRYYSLLAAELGPDFYRNVLKPIVDARRYEVTSRIADTIKANLDLDEGPFDTVVGYLAQRAFVSEHGLGTLFQVDHIIEQRIIRYWVELLHMLEHEVDTFGAAIVPANRFADANLEAAKLRGFLWVHPVKTALMEKWVPGGTEAQFTLQKLFDAYQLVYVHEMRFGYDTFLNMVQDDFRHLHQMLRDTATELIADEGIQALAGHSRLAEAHHSALDVSQKSRDQLLRSVTSLIYRRP